MFSLWPLSPTIVWAAFTDLLEPCGLQAGGWTRLLGFLLSRTRIVFRPRKLLFEFQACCYPVTLGRTVCAGVSQAPSALTGPV